jgi:hypothetical protein
MRMIDINGPYSYYWRSTATLSFERQAYKPVPEHELLKDLAAAVEFRDGLNKAIGDMKFLLLCKGEEQ